MERSWPLFFSMTTGVPYWPKRRKMPAGVLLRVVQDDKRILALRRSVEPENEAVSPLGAVEKEPGPPSCESASSARGFPVSSTNRSRRAERVSSSCGAKGRDAAISAAELPVRMPQGVGAKESANETRHHPREICLCHTGLYRQSFLECSLRGRGGSVGRTHSALGLVGRHCGRSMPGEHPLYSPKGRRRARRRSPVASVG